MRRSLAIVLLIATFETGGAMADMCSSRDGQKYCSCEFNQTCTSNENSCACIRDADQPQLPVLNPPPPRSSQQSPTRMPDLPRRETAPTAPGPAAPALTDNDERTPAEYVQPAHKLRLPPAGWALRSNSSTKAKRACWTARLR